MNEGTVALVALLPSCDFCRMGGIDRPGRYDFATTLGRWANGCVEHYMLHRRSPMLGTGFGQLLVQYHEVLDEVLVAQEGDRLRLRQLGLSNSG